MVSVLIPLVGVVELEESCLHAIGMVITAKVSESVDVDEEIYAILIREKYQGRYRCVNDVIRSKFGLPLSHPRVKRFSDEGEQNGISNEAHA